MASAFFVGKHNAGNCLNSRIIAAVSGARIMHVQEPPKPQIDAKFRRLASEWKAATEYLSSTTKMSMHPAYQQIIGMGAPVIPLLLRELNNDPDHWFWALHAITGEDPVPEADRGNISRMAQAWIEWGRNQGYCQ